MFRHFLVSLSLASLLAAPTQHAWAQEKTENKQMEMMSSGDMQARMDKMGAQMEEMMKMMKDMHSNMGKMMGNGQCPMMDKMMGSTSTKKKATKKTTPPSDDHASHHPEEGK